MIRFLSLGIAALAFMLPACSSQPAEPEPPPPAEAPPAPIPPPPVFVDVLPEFKKSSRSYLDLAKKLDELANANSPPAYPAFWKDSVPLEEIYSKVINNEPKSGAGANTFERINKIRDSLFKTQLILKNTENLKTKQVSQLLETEAGKRKPVFDEAEFFWKQTPDFTKFASTVYLVHRRDQLRASKIMQERALGNPKITMKWNRGLHEVLGTEQDGVTGVRLKSTQDDSTEELTVGGVFLAIGHTPNTDFLEGQVQIDAKGYIVWTKPQRTNTSVEGVFAAGDVADNYYKQAVTAAGTGCAAALDAERWLAEKGH